MGAVCTGTVCTELSVQELSAQELSEWELTEWELSECGSLLTQVYACDMYRMCASFFKGGCLSMRTVVTVFDLTFNRDNM